MKYAKNIIIAWVVGFVSGLLNRNAMAAFSSLKQPALFPPGWLFPVVWTILYVLMGISLTLVEQASPQPLEKRVVYLYYLQLFVNFAWPFLFFGLGLFWPAFGWLLFLLVLVAWMAFAFWRVRPLAGYLQIPYLLWLLFAAYLNCSVAILN